MKHQLVNLGARLRSLRWDAHKSQQALADRCRGLGLPITRDMIANWETNRAEMPAQLIPLIAYALNAQVADLLPDLRKSAFADLQRVSATPGDPAKNVQKPTAQALANQQARVISEPAKARCHVSGVKSVFLGRERHESSRRADPFGNPRQIDDSDPHAASPASASTAPPLLQRA